MSTEKPFSWTHPGLETRDTNLCGRGVFTTTDIAMGQVLCVMGGYVVRIVDIVDDYGIQINEDFVLSNGGGRKHDDDYFNHRCAPNAGIKGESFLVAIRDIWVGEEVCFDYAMCLHAAPGAPRYEMRCKELSGCDHRG